MKNIVLIMTLIVSCLFAGCDSLANKSEDKLSGDDFGRREMRRMRKHFVEHIQFVSECNNVTTSFPHV